MTSESPWPDYDIGTIVRSQQHADDGELVIVGFLSINTATVGGEENILSGTSHRTETRLRNSGESYTAVMLPIETLDQKYPGWRHAIRDGRIAFYEHCAERFDEVEDTHNRYGIRRAITPLGYPALTPPAADP